MNPPGNPGILTGAHWKDAMGQAWGELAPVLERMNRPVGEAAMQRLGIVAGDRVLDVGCGTGDTSLAIAGRVAPGGRCLGVDIARPLLSAAREAAEAAGVGNVEFLEADAQSHAFESGAFDVVYSRYGVMFFDDPDAAFSNLKRATAPEGRLAFVCWRSARDNVLSVIAVDAARPFLPPIPMPDPEGPGRFAFADPERVRGIFERSGWRRVEIAPLDVTTPATLDELMALNLKLGALGPILREQPEEIRHRVRDAVQAALAPHAVNGVVPLVAACWLVSATA